MQILSTMRGLAFASVGVLSLVGCDSLRIDQGVVNTDDPAVFRCSTDEDCLSGYRCLANVGTSYSVCTAVGAGLNCEQYNLDGDLYLADAPDLPEACFGLRGDCDDEDPNTYPGAPEICDGKDNSCNGVVDDGLDTMPCAKQLGVCQGSTTACVSGAVESCDEPVNGGASIYESHSDLYSEVELCDGVDNNCDGTIDEGCCDASLPLTGAGAGGNAGCNCVEGQVFACGTDAGTCSRGVRICASADVPAASLPCLELEPEPTADLQSCDPEVDIWSEGDTRVCITERVGIFEDLNDSSCASPDAPGCTRSVWRELADLPAPVACETNADCTGDREICAFDNVCRPGNVTPVAEICNGLDDDCDGSVDNHFGNARTSACGECPFNTVKMEYSTTGAGASSWTCIDLYEASRPDASAGSAGVDSTHAVAQRGVLPWTGISAQDAQNACEALELRDKLDLDPQNASRVRMVPAKTLCDNDGWAQACSGERAQGTGGNLRHYPYGTTGFQPDMCNDASSPNSLMPTGDNVDCWRPDPANSGLDFADCVDAPGGNCRVFPVDMIGNAMEWTILRGGFGTPNPAPAIRLMGGSYAESKDLTCRVTFGHAMTQNSGPTVRTDSGILTSCNTDADCPGTSACGTGLNLVRRCYEPCAVDGDCARGECTNRADLQGAPLGCGLPHFTTGDYTGYDDVGFRCCANPLAP